MNHSQEENTNILAANSLDHIVRRSSKELCNNRKLIDMILSREERFSLNHLRENAGCAPDVHLHVVLLPCKHDLGGAVVSCRNVAGHLRILNTGKTEIADLEVAVVVDEEVLWLQVPVDNPCGVDVFQPALGAELVG